MPHSGAAVEIHTVLHRAVPVRTSTSSAAMVMAASAAGFAWMASVARIAAMEVSGAQIAFVRFLCGSLFCLVFHLLRPLVPRNLPVLALRGVLGGGAVLCFFASLGHLPVGIATLLQYSAPAFTALAASLFLGEALTLRTVAALAVTLLGISLVVHGQAPAVASTVYGRWELVSVLGAICSGAAVTAIRKLRASESAVTIFAAFNLFGALVTAGPALHAWVNPSPHVWGLIILVAAISIASQLGMTWSLRWLRAAAGGLLMQLTPVGALAIGALAFHENIHPLAWLGAAVTIAGITVGAMSRTAEKPSPAAAGFAAAAPTPAGQPDRSSKR